MAFPANGKSGGLFFLFFVFGSFLLDVKGIDHSSEWSILLLVFGVFCCFLLSPLGFCLFLLDVRGIDHSNEWSILLLLFVVFYCSLVGFCSCLLDLQGIDHSSEWSILFMFFVVFAISGWFLFVFIGFAGD